MTKPLCAITENAALKRKVEQLEQEIQRLKKNHIDQETSRKKKLIAINKKITGLKNEKNKSVEQYVTDIKDYFENLIAFMPGHVYWMDKNNVFLGCNGEQAKSANLVSRHEIVGKTNYDMPWRKQAKKLNDVNNKVMAENKPYVAEELATMAYGAGVFLSHKVPLHDHEGNVIGLLGISFDITDRKKLEKELKEAKEAAELANTIKTNFIQNMEHDIRTPFSGIYGLTSILTEQENDPTKKSLLNEILGSAKELLDYCNTILDFSHIESGHIPITSKRFNLEALINGVVRMEMPAANLKNLELKTYYQKEAPKIIFGDDFRIKRILINLMSNSIKFTNAGHVAVNVRLINTEDSHKKREVILAMSVEDSGIGIPKNMQDRLFEKFEKRRPSNQGITRGHGLGLRIVKQFMDDLSGDIDIISQEGKGTKIIFSLPFKIPLTDALPKGEN